MEIVEKLIHSLRGWFNRFSTTWLRVNPNAIARELDVDQRASADGARNEPGLYSVDLDGTQGDIANYFDELLVSVQQRLDRAYHKVCIAAVKVDAAGAIAGLSDAAREFEQSPGRASAVLQAKINGRLERAVEAESEYEAYQKSNNLARGAKLPKLRPIYVCFIAMCSFGLAVAIHGWRGQAFDLENVASFMYISVPLAALCCLLPAMVGAFITRDVNHRNLTQGFFGTLFTLLTVVFLFVLSIWYDRGFEVAPDLDYAWQSIQNWYHYPSQLLSMDWSTFATVMLAGISCLVAGYAMDDPYPGYGAARRRMDRTRDGYAKLIDVQRGTLNDEVSHRRKVMEGTLRKTRARYNRFLKLRQRYETKRQRYNMLHRTFTDSANALLSRYRQANIEANPNPGAAEAASFGTTYEPSSPERTLLASDAELAAWGALEAEMQQLEESFESTRQRMARVVTGRVVNVDFAPTVMEPLPDRVRQRLTRSAGARAPYLSPAGTGY